MTIEKIFVSFALLEIRVHATKNRSENWNIKQMTLFEFRQILCSLQIFFLHEIYLCCCFHFLETPTEQADTKRFFFQYKKSKKYAFKATEGNCFDFLRPNYPCGRMSISRWLRTPWWGWLDQESFWIFRYFFPQQFWKALKLLGHKKGGSEFI